MTVQDTVRVRFAPSPTGFLHIGGARTALFNWLYARSRGGKFLLRIEDTDRERSETRFTDDILESLRWLGFQWDEPPVFQSARFERYTAVAHELVAKGLAYPCDCTPAMLDAVREQCTKEKRPFRYPGTCKGKANVSDKHVLRAVVTNEGETAFTDDIRGPISFSNKDIDDWVIMRADGSPTYNFSVVVDDHDQMMTHILRGDDHINNTPKQILLYQALGWKPPVFAHLPMILGADKTKLSKRHGAASTLEYRKMGYLPEALINFLVRLGWSHGDQEFFAIDELQRLFSLDKIGKANAIFNPEKLNWISGHFMRETPSGRLRTYTQEYFPEEMGFVADVPADRLEAGIAIIQGKVKNIPEMIEQLHCLFGADPSYDVSALKPGDADKFKTLLTSLEPVLQASAFDRAPLEAAVRGEAEKLGQKLAPLAQALRFAVTGGKISPGLFEMLEIQGKETVLRRVQNALRVL
jgi:glutamyl-tRNA synthetase